MKTVFGKFLASEKHVTIHIKSMMMWTRAGCREKGRRQRKAKFALKGNKKAVGRKAVLRLFTW